MAPTPSVRGPAPAAGTASALPRTVAPDRFVIGTETSYAGLHLIADFWGARHLQDVGILGTAMRAAAGAAGATLLHLHLHPFGEGQGVSGVAVLAESHISVHTWPERGYAAFDAFLCGNTDAGRALAVLEERLRPQRVETRTIERGRIRRNGNSRP